MHSSGTQIFLVNPREKPEAMLKTEEYNVAEIYRYKGG